MSGDLRSLSTNTWSPLRDPHSFLTVTCLTAWYCQFKYGRIVSVLPLRLRELSRDNMNNESWCNRGSLNINNVPAMNPAQKLTSYYLLPLRGREPHFRFGVPANHLASLSFPFRCPANTWSPLRDPHSLLTVTFWLLDSADSTRGG